MKPQNDYPLRFIDVFGKFLLNAMYDRRSTILLYGGAGSGKSYATAQFIIMLWLMVIDPIKILITRKTNPSLKLTAYKLILKMLDELEIEYIHMKSEQTIQLLDGSEIIFRGMDDPEKIKSAEFNVIWMEEATEFTEKDFQQLKLRLRRPVVRLRDGEFLQNKIILTFNPISIHSWIYKFFFEHDNQEVLKLHTTYQNNPFLDSEYIKMLETLAEQDETFYKIYTLGEFVTPTNLIYTNYTIIDDFPENFDEIIYGLDFGFNNPTALVKIGIRDGEYYIFEELYQTRLTNSDLIEYLKQINVDGIIYADSAEPARIQEIQAAGFMIYPAEKNVRDGIDFVKRQKLHIHPSAANVIKELQNYKWKEDRNGNILDEPVKFLDHACDAIRYAIYTHSRGQQVGIQFV